MCIATCHCERSAAIRFRVCVATAVFLLAIVSTATAKYSGGSGTAQDPYQIATAADLIALGETPADYDEHFILTADIDLDPKLPGRKLFDKAVIAPDTDPVKSGFQGTPFTGVFDGNGHTISHLIGYGGLFGQLASGGEVSRLGVVAVNIVGSDGYSYVGALVGYNSGAVTQCYSTGAVSETGQYFGGSVGGLVGGNAGTLTQCYSTGAVSGTRWVGGLVGSNGGDLNDCYSTGRVSGYSEIGGLVGSSGGSVTHCYSTGAVSGTSQYVGGLVGYRPEGKDVGVVTGSFWDTQTSAQATSAGGIGKTTAQMRTARTFLFWAACGNEGIWTIDEGKACPRLSWENQPGEAIRRAKLSDILLGTGTENDPFLISTPEGLNVVGLSPCAWDKHFKLMADIDLSGFDGKDGRPAFNIIAYDPWAWGETPFTGAFDGNGHTISHLTIKGENHVGLFGCLAAGGAVKNLGVVDVNISGSGDVAGLVGYSEGSVTQCYSTGSVSGDRYIGGLVGFNRGNVSRCYSTDTVSGGGSVGGLVGSNGPEGGGTVTQCYSTGAVNGSSDVGGLVGTNGTWAAVTNSYSTATVSGDKSVGGLVGCNVSESGSQGMQSFYYCGRVSQCYSTGAVSGQSDVGGLVGSSGGEDEVRDCFWDVQTSRQTRSAGGVGKTTLEMQRAITFLCWAGDGTWTIDEGKDYPRMWWENRPGEPLTRTYVYGGGAGTKTSPYLIYTAEELNAISFAECDWNKHFKLMADIDLSAKTWSGPVIPRFAGAFDGSGHTISHLTIRGGSYLGLFGHLEAGAEVRDLGVVDANVVGSGDCVGGLVGSNGDLLGDSGGAVTRCYVTGRVSTAAGLGGIYYVYVGGLVGENHGMVTQCYSSASVSGDHIVGGLVGSNGNHVGPRGGGTVTQCYSTSAVIGKQYVGGLVGLNGWDGVVTASFWDTQTSGQVKSAGGMGRTTVQMQAAKTFLDSGWDFVGESKNGTADIWWIVEGKDYPRLWWEAAKK